jgi:hypothetical protein
MFDRYVRRDLASRQANSLGKVRHVQAGSIRATRRTRVSTAAACAQTESMNQNTGACCHCATVLPLAQQSRPDLDFRLNFKAFAGLI